MNLKLKQIKSLVRSLGLLPLAEKAREMVSPIKYYNRNKKFISEHPNFILPPKDLAYDAYGGIDWGHYHDSGIAVAGFLKNIAEKYHSNPFIGNVLEWGCGPGRIIRHLPDTFPPECKIYGMDYNSKTIEWCKRNLLNISFEKNELLPPSPFKDENLDYIFAPSVFTHLSENANMKWMEEIHRIIKPKGIFVFSTMGNFVKDILLESELKIFESKGFLTREKFTEGKKNFAAYHTPEFVEKLIKEKFSLVEFKEQGFLGMKQDLWIVKKQ